LAEDEHGLFRHSRRCGKAVIPSVSEGPSLWP
jgi:hypothetical protein